MHEVYQDRWRKSGGAGLKQINGQGEAELLAT